MQAITGNPDLVHIEAVAMRETATVLNQAAIQLDGLANTDQSRALDALGAAISELASALRSVHTRYDPVGPALETYAPALRSAMNAVDAAILEKDSTDVGHAQRAEILARAHEVSLLANPFASQHDLQQAAENARQAESETQHAHAVAQHAAAHYEDAMTALHAAARAAAGQIEMGINDSHLNDGFSQYARSAIQHLDNVLSLPLAIIHDILSSLSEALSVIGIGLALLLPEGPGEAADFFLSLASDALTILDVEVETVRYEFGDISYGDYVTEMVLDLAGLMFTFAGGKATAKLFGEGQHARIADNGLDLVDDEVNDKVQDPIAGWVDSQTQGPPTLKTYLDSGTFHPVDFSEVDPDQIVEQSGVDVPGRIRVVSPAATAPVQVAPPAQLPVQLRVYSSPVGV